MSKTLYDKLWENHVVHLEDDGTALLYIDRHLVHEVTSPQAFDGLRAAGRQPRAGVVSVALRQDRRITRRVADRDLGCLAARTLGRSALASRWRGARGCVTSELQGSARDDGQHWIGGIAVAT